MKIKNIKIVHTINCTKLVTYLNSLSYKHNIKPVKLTIN